jgi:hypothetical protein
LWFGISDGPIFAPPDVGPAFLALGHEDVEGGFQMRSQIASLVLLSSANFLIFGPDLPWLSIFSYDNLFAFGRFGLK